MKKILATSILAVVVASGAALAQTSTQKAPAAPPATVVDAASDAKFKAVDKNGSGIIEGAELTAYTADMAKIDTDKDGKISRLEFAAAVKSGVIK